MEIIPSVYQITRRSTNVILIVEEELTLVDTGVRGSSAVIESFVRKLGRSIEEVTLIILTHNHLDHMGGLAKLRKLTGAKVAAHKADIIGLNDRLPYPWGIRILLRTLPFSKLRSFFYVSSNEIDIQLEGGEVLRPLGGLSVIHVPGHTPGSISLYAPQKKLLIVGDALNKHHNSPYLPHRTIATDFEQAKDSAKRIAELDFDILCFGHGRPIIGGASAKVRELVRRHGL